VPQTLVDAPAHIVELRLVQLGASFGFLVVPVAVIPVVRIPIR